MHFARTVHSGWIHTAQGRERAHQVVLVPAAGLGRVAVGIREQRCEGGGHDHVTVPLPPHPSTHTHTTEAQTSQQPCNARRGLAVLLYGIMGLALEYTAIAPPTPAGTMPPQLPPATCVLGRSQPRLRHCRHSVSDDVWHSTRQEVLVDSTREAQAGVTAWCLACEPHEAETEEEKEEEEEEECTHTRRRKRAAMCGCTSRTMSSGSPSHRLCYTYPHT